LAELEGKAREKVITFVAPWESPKLKNIERVTKLTSPWPEGRGFHEIRHSSKHTRGELSLESS